MPNAKKYQSLKNNPNRFAHKKSQNKEWRQQNKEKHPFIHFSKDFYHRRKIKIDKFQFWCIAKKQKLICPLTGRKLTGKNMSLDHIIPASKGGTHDISNLQFVHVDANYAKQNLKEIDFIELCIDVANHHNTGLL